MKCSKIKVSSRLLYDASMNVMSLCVVCFLYRTIPMLGSVIVQCLVDIVYL